MACIGQFICGKAKAVVTACFYALLLVVMIMARPVQAAELSDKAHALTAKALDSIALRGDYDTAIRYYEAALKEMPNDRGILIALSHAEYEREKRLGLIKPASNAKAAILLDALQSGKGDWQASIRYLENAILEEQDKDRLMATRDALVEIRGIYEDDLFEKNLARNLLTEGTWEEATVESLRDAFRNLEKGYFDKAMNRLEWALKINPGDARIREIIAYVSGLQYSRFESLNAWAENQRRLNGKLRGEALQRKKEAMHALAQSQKALNLSRELQDVEAESISRQAVDIAKQALSKANAMLARAEARLSAVKKAYDAAASGAAGLASRLKGDIRIRAENSWKRFDANVALRPGDELRTGKESSAELILTDGSTLNMDANSSIRLGQPQRKKSLYEKIKGQIRTEVTCIRKFGLPCRRVCYRINTQAACVRGTELEIKAPVGKAAVITVINGMVEIGDQKEGEQIKVGKGQRIVITTKGELKEHVAIEPDSINRWWEEAF
jgi:ferric-dicitrate binding protein FerR (iron transport regulator)